MHDNNSGCCGEDELPSEELEQDQIYKVKNGFRVKGEVRIRGKHTNRLVVLPEDRYVYVDSSSNANDNKNPIDINLSSSSTDMSSTIKSLFGDVIRSLISRPSMMQSKNHNVICGDLVKESEEESTLNETTNKLYEWTSVKQSEISENPLKKRFTNKLNKLTRCFGIDNGPSDITTVSANVEIITEYTDVVNLQHHWVSLEVNSSVIPDIFDFANQNEPKVLENCGDFKSNVQSAEKTKSLNARTRKSKFSTNKKKINSKKIYSPPYTNSVKNFKKSLIRIQSTNSNANVIIDVSNLNPNLKDKFFIKESFIGYILERFTTKSEKNFKKPIQTIPIQRNSNHFPDKHSKRVMKKSYLKIIENVKRDLYINSYLKAVNIVKSFNLKRSTRNKNFVMNIINNNDERKRELQIENKPKQDFYEKYHPYTFKEHQELHKRAEDQIKQIIRKNNTILPIKTKSQINLKYELINNNEESSESLFVGVWPVESRQLVEQIVTRPNVSRNTGIINALKFAIFLKFYISENILQQNDFVKPISDIKYESLKEITNDHILTFSSVHVQNIKVKDILRRIEEKFEKKIHSIISHIIIKSQLNKLLSKVRKNSNTYGTNFPKIYDLIKNQAFHNDNNMEIISNHNDMQSIKCTLPMNMIKQKSKIYNIFRKYHFLFRYIHEPMSFSHRCRGPENLSKYNNSLTAWSELSKIKIYRNLNPRICTNKSNKILIHSLLKSVPILSYSTLNIKDKFEFYPIKPLPSSRIINITECHSFRHMSRNVFFRININYTTATISKSFSSYSYRKINDNTLLDLHRLSGNTASAVRKTKYGETLNDLLYAENLSINQDKLIKREKTFKSTSVNAELYIMKDDRLINETRNKPTISSTTNLNEPYSDNSQNNTKISQITRLFNPLTIANEHWSVNCKSERSVLHDKSNFHSRFYSNSSKVIPTLCSSDSRIPIIPNNYIDNPSIISIDSSSYTKSEFNIGKTGPINIIIKISLSISLEEDNCLMKRFINQKSNYKSTYPNQKWKMTSSRKTKDLKNKKSDIGSTKIKEFSKSTMNAGKTNASNRNSDGRISLNMIEQETDQTSKHNKLSSKTLNKNKNSFNETNNMNFSKNVEFPNGSNRSPKNMDISFHLTIENLHAMNKEIKLNFNVTPDIPIFINNLKMVTTSMRSIEKCRDVSDSSHFRTYKQPGFYNEYINSGKEIVKFDHKTDDEVTSLDKSYNKEKKKIIIEKMNSEVLFSKPKDGSINRHITSSNETFFNKYTKPSTIVEKDLSTENTFTKNKVFQSSYENLESNDYFESIDITTKSTGNRQYDSENQTDFHKTNIELEKNWYDNINSLNQIDKFSQKTDYEVTSLDKTYNDEKKKNNIEKLNNKLQFNQPKDSSIDQHLNPDDLIPIVTSNKCKENLSIRDNVKYSEKSTEILSIVEKDLSIENLSTKNKVPQLCYKNRELNDYFEPVDITAKSRSSGKYDSKNQTDFDKTNIRREKNWCDDSSLKQIDKYCQKTDHELTSLDKTYNDEKKKNNIEKRNNDIELNKPRDGSINRHIIPDNSIPIVTNCKNQENMSIRDEVEFSEKVTEILPIVEKHLSIENIQTKDGVQKVCCENIKLSHSSTHSTIHSTSVYGQYDSKDQPNFDQTNTGWKTNSSNGRVGNKDKQSEWEQFYKDPKKFCNNPNRKLVSNMETETQIRQKTDCDEEGRKQIYGDYEQSIHSGSLDIHFVENIYHSTENNLVDHGEMISNINNQKILITDQCNSFENMKVNNRKEDPKIYKEFNKFSNSMRDFSESDMNNSETKIMINDRIPDVCYNKNKRNEDPFFLCNKSNKSTVQKLDCVCNTITRFIISGNEPIQCQVHCRNAHAGKEFQIQNKNSIPDIIVKNENRRYNVETGYMESNVKQDVKFDDNTLSTGRLPKNAMNYKSSNDLELQRNSTSVQVSDKFLIDKSDTDSVHEVIPKYNRSEENAIPSTKHANTVPKATMISPPNCDTKKYSVKCLPNSCERMLACCSKNQYNQRFPKQFIYSLPCGQCHKSCATSDRFCMKKNVAFPNTYQNKCGEYSPAKMNRFERLSNDNSRCHCGSTNTGDRKNYYS